MLILRVISTSLSSLYCEMCSANLSFLVLPFQKIVLGFSLLAADMVLACYKGNGICY